MKTSTKILSTIVILLSLIAFLLVDSFFIAPTRFTVRNETIENDKIPDQMNHMNILFFSDLKYGTFMDEKRLDKLIDTINHNGPDVVIFGGDLYDDSVAVNEEANKVIMDAFEKIKAKYGKFAVYGDIDESSDTMKSAVNAIYAGSDFEVIQNNSFQIHKNGSQFITLVGLDNAIDGTPDVTSAYANVSADSFVFTICHTPDSATSVPEDLTDYFLSGHSLGGQVNFFFTTLYAPTYATTYLRGKHEIDNAFTLDITDGTGTTKQDVRFLTSSEVVIYTLKQTKKSEETKPSNKLKTTQKADSRLGSAN